MKILEVTFVQNNQHFKTFKMLTRQNSTYLTTKNGSKINSEFYKKFQNNCLIFPNVERLSNLSKYFDVVLMSRL